MSLKLTTKEGDMVGLDKSMLRNLSKIHVLLWVVDTLIGTAMVGDPHQKCSDRFAVTTVASTVEKDLIMPIMVADTSQQTPSVNA